jgi:hypothetical protein
MNNNIFSRQNVILGLLVLVFLLFFLNIYDVIKIENGYNMIFNKIKSISLSGNENENEPVNVFIDLGANKGDSIYNFVGLNSGAQGGNFNNSLFPQSFRTAKWIIYGFEANSFFDNQLVKMKQDVEKLGHTIYLYKSTAAWIYDGTIDFYLDTVNAGNDFWGSSLNKNHVIIKPIYKKLYGS